MTDAPTPTAQANAFGYAAADDPATGQVVVYGGSSGTGSDTWIWNGPSWRLASPATQPPPLFSGTAAYDPVLQMVVLAGGEPFGAAENNGTWGWDGTTWHELDADISQPPVGGGTMAWDPALQQMVLVTAASAASSSSSQTWIWSGSNWTARGGHALFQANGVVLGFDESLNALVAVSCCASKQPSTNTGAMQTWRWNGSAWRLFAADVIPSMPAVVGVGWDSITHSLLMSGQQFIGPLTAPVMPAAMWRLVGQKWVALKAVPTPLVSPATMIEAGDGLRLIVASSTVEGSSTPYHIWAWAGAGWKQLG